MIVATRKAPISLPVQRPTSLVRTTRPDLCPHDSTRVNRVKLPRVHVRQKQHDGLFYATLEIPLIHAVWLKRWFPAAKNLESFVSNAIRRGLAGQQRHAARTDYELWVAVQLHVRLPIVAIRKLDAFSGDPDALAAVLGGFLDSEIQDREAAR